MLIKSEVFVSRSCREMLSFLAMPGIESFTTTGALHSTVGIVDMLVDLHPGQRVGFLDLFVGFVQSRESWTFSDVLGVSFLLLSALGDFLEM